MTNRLLASLILLSISLCVSCERVPRLVEYGNNQERSTAESLSAAPIILVGQIAAYRELGRPRPSRFDAEPIQLCRITVQVETVLRGDVAPGEVPIYFLVNFGSTGGPPQLGMVGRTGNWRIGDRELFFLQRDSGTLRTIIDNYALAARPVLTGAHTSYEPRPGETVPEMIVDILLTRGQECSDQQMAHAVSRSVADFFDLPYTVRKLRQLANDEVPIVKKAALDKLDELSNSWPKIRSGWPDAEQTVPRK